MLYYLYVKTHRTTKLKYLGITQAKDPHKYWGSGIHWVKHLRRHGATFTTKIIFKTTSRKKLIVACERASKKWNVARSKEWANLCNESGKGGTPGARRPDLAEYNRKIKTGSRLSKAARQRISLGHKGIVFSSEHRRNLSEAAKGRKRPDLAARNKRFNAARGKTYEQMYGKRKAAELKELRRQTLHQRNT
jgi:hypothetical protein